MQHPQTRGDVYLGSDCRTLTPARLGALASALPSPDQNHDARFRRHRHRKEAGNEMKSQFAARTLRAPARTRFNGFMSHRCACTWLFDYSRAFTRPAAIGRSCNADI